MEARFPVRHHPSMEIRMFSHKGHKIPQEKICLPTAVGRGSLFFYFVWSCEFCGYPRLFGF
jgi:hypothetical protein